jgi:hypothetical protein
MLATIAKPNASDAFAAELMIVAWKYWCRTIPET